MAGIAYAYFDKNGVLKEFITDPSLREGNTGYNTIRFYWDEYPTLTSLSFRLKKSTDTSYTSSFPIEITTVPTIIPSYTDRDLSYFIEGETYGMFSFEITSPTTIASLSDGSWELVITATYEDTETPPVVHTLDLALITFLVESTITVDDYGISKSQFDILLSKITGSAGQAWVIEHFLKKYDANSIRGYKGTVTDTSSLITNQLILLSDSTDEYVSVKIKQGDGTLKGLIVDNALGDKNGDEIDTTYLKLAGGTMTGGLNFSTIASTDSAIEITGTNFNVKGSGDLTTNNILVKGNNISFNSADGEIRNLKDLDDTSGATLATNKHYVDTKDTALSNRITTNEGNITTLQQEVIRIEDSKNIADIVGTYAELLAYPAVKFAKLKVDDIIEVLADESRPEPDTGGTTMYRLTSKSPVTWTYVGIMHIPAGQLNNTYLRRDGAYPMTNNLNMGGKAITNALDPTNAQDVATKNSSETFTNSKVFRIIDNTDVFDLKIQIVGSDAQLIATKR